MKTGMMLPTQPDRMHNFADTPSTSTFKQYSLSACGPAVEDTFDCATIRADRKRMAKQIFSMPMPDDRTSPLKI